MSSASVWGVLYCCKWFSVVNADTADKCNVLVMVGVHAASTPEAAFDSWQSVDKYAEHSLFWKDVSIKKILGWFTR